MKLSTVTHILKASRLANDAQFSSISTDTRTLKKGDLFFAIKGEKFNGHDFISTALAKGAVGAVVSDSVKTTLPVIKVKDTIKALGELAHYHRVNMPAKVIAITGSCGKTTTRALTASIFGLKYSTLSSIRSFNNEIGVPLTLFNLQPTHQYAVLELGASHVGEISMVVNIAAPVDVAIITSIAPAHLSGFGSLANIVKAKFEITEGLNSSGVAILPLCEYEKYWSDYKKHEVVTFDLNSSKANVYAKDIRSDAHNRMSFNLFTPKGQCAIQLQLAGKHNVQNALAAAAAAIVKDVPIEIIQRGLELTKAVDHRLNIFKGLRDAIVIDDAYNANPCAVKAAIDLLCTYKKKRILVMGDMLELGDEANRYHSMIGDYAREKHIHELFLLGELSQSVASQFGTNAHHYPTHEALITELKNSIDDNTVILIKGSFSMNMQKVVSALMKGSQR
jgi:UDP-N-acetylmuramoyl-tripeptide--D-alanyl-D-alanine ligase